jgi:hypothetical protein
VTFAHVIYIPMVAMVGILLGIFVGARGARNAMDLERRREEERIKVRAEREAKKAARAASSGAPKDPPAAA